MSEKHLTTRLVRFNMNLPEPLHRWLVREATRLGINVSELIRRILDEKRGASS